MRPFQIFLWAENEEHIYSFPISFGGPICSPCCYPPLMAKSVEHCFLLILAEQALIEASLSMARM